MTDTPTLSFVLPCYNESGNLRELVQTLRGVLEPLGITYEFVITDDCSKDQSWAVLQELAADPRVRAQRFAFNCGQSAALWAGMKAARAKAVAAE